ncbi:saccharopine dehydrogenase NADP-binding domain-containing protein [Pontibacter sp. G13]|uniref:saccharopine dehydrogenase family protein n=1 Tax=Pontibacter sp. G13 TaxID=3074898 RepID=UPI00288ADF03|nr:saccharopine dehydrogenase NADP-binding domain-containing protein [Pontibacter sp. G13]WNJ21306.1 saccharopine dehydrogenase NADP-binding domain-containing protein [Pontibacter sp. G13]
MAILIYGANGYTGELIAELAKSRGTEVILAGRNAAAVQEIADSLGFEARIFSLDQPAQVDAGLAGITVVLHCAGPFVHTAGPMMDACLRLGIHYLDITGEIPVFEAAASRDSQAKQKNIMILPGTGFDVVPTDSLAANLKAALPSATHLNLGFKTKGGLSRGTAKTAVEHMEKGGMIREDGRIRVVPNAYEVRKIDFGEGELSAVTIPWGDVSTGFYSTGIPNIKVFLAMPPKTIANMKRGRYLGWLLGMPFVKRYLKKQIDKRPAGPDQNTRTSGYVLLWGEAWDDQGNHITARLKTMEGYKLTSIMALDIAEKVMAGNWKAGFQTPSNAYGKDLVFEVEGSEWLDAPAPVTAG